MVASCQDLRDAVALCLQRSECVLVQRHTPKECLENPDLNKDLPQPCYVHLLRYMDCKRGQADRTKRFRGNGPLSNGKFVEDLQKMEKGDFDPALELKMSSGPDMRVTSRAEAQTRALRDNASSKADVNRSWWKFW